MTILAIDPGHTRSAYVVYNSTTRALYSFAKVANEDMLPIIAAGHGPVVIEQVACMGMPVGAEVFETVFWSGRFAQVCEQETPYQWDRIKRHEI